MTSCAPVLPSLLRELTRNSRRTRDTGDSVTNHGGLSVETENDRHFSRRHSCCPLATNQFCCSGRGQLSKLNPLTVGTSTRDQQWPGGGLWRARSGEGSVGGWALEARHRGWLRPRKWTTWQARHPVAIYSADQSFFGEVSFGEGRMSTGFPWRNEHFVEPSTKCSGHYDVRESERGSQNVRLSVVEFNLNGRSPGNQSRFAGVRQLRLAALPSRLVHII